MRRVIIAALAGAAAFTASSAQAAIVPGDPYFLKVISGQDCPVPAAGGFSNCWATQNGTVGTAPTDPTASRVVGAFNANGSVSDLNSGSYPLFTGGEVAFSIANQVLSFTYTMGTGDPKLTYLSIKQANGYALFYNSAGFSSGTTYTFNLNSYFPNNPGISHLTVFDSTGGAVPEPATWAMMLVGFGGIGMAMRRKQRRNGALMQVA